MTDSAPAISTAPVRPRRRWWRWLAAVAALALFFAAGASLAVYLLADREQLRTALEQQLGRPVKLAGLAPGFLAVNLRGLEIADTAAFAPDPLLTLEAASIAPAWGSLLAGKLRIDRITLQEAKLHVEFDTAGNCNLAGLLRPATGENIVTLDQLVFDDCVLAVTWPQREIVISALSGTVGHLAAEPYTLDLAAAAGSGTLHLKGGLAPQQSAGKLVVTCEALPLALLGLAPGTLPDSAALNAALEFALTGGRATLVGSGTAPALLRSYSLDLFAPWPLPAPADTATLPPITGTVSAVAPVSDLRALPLLAPALNAIDGQGEINMQLVLDGSGMIQAGQPRLKFVDCSLAVAGLRDRLTNLNGPFQVTATEMLIQPSTFSVGGLPLSGAGRIGFKPFTLSLAIDGDNLDLARAAALPATTALPAGITVSGPGRAEMIITRNGDATDISGTLTLKGAGIALTQPPFSLAGMTGSIFFNPRGLQLQNVTAQTCGGNVHVDGSVATGGRYPFTLALNAKKLGLAPLLNALVAPNTARGGTLDAALRLAGDSAIFSTYNGNGWLTLDQPQFAEAAIFAKLAPYLGLKDPAMLSRYDTGAAAFTVTRGIFSFAQPVRLHNAAVDFAAAGTVDLAGPLQLRGQVGVPRNMLLGFVGGTPLGQFGGVRNEGDKTVIGFKVGGTLTAPGFGADSLLDDLLGAPGAIAASPARVLDAVFGAVLRPRSDTAATPATATPATPDSRPFNPLRELGGLFRLPPR